MNNPRFITPLICLGLSWFASGFVEAETPQSSVRQLVEKGNEIVLKKDAAGMEALIQAARGDGVMLPEAADGLPLLSFMPASPDMSEMLHQFR